jgi:O-antigen/teichoic acid export membrane protein
MQLKRAGGMIENNRLELARKASEAFLWNHTLFIAATAISAVTTYVMASFMTPTSYGLFTSVMAFAAFVQWAVSLGFEGAINVHIPRLLGSLPRLRFMLKRLLGLRAAVLVVLCVAIFACKDVIRGGWLPIGIGAVGEYFPLAVLVAAMTVLCGFLVRVMETLFRVKQMAVVRLASLLAAMLAVYACLSLGYGITAVLWITVVTSAMALGGYFIFCRDVVLGDDEAFPLADVYSFSRAAWLATLAGYALGKSMDVIVMAFYNVPKSDVAFYQIAFVLVDYAYVSVTKGLTGVLQSAFARAYNDGGSASLSGWWRTTMKFQILVCAPPVLFLVLFPSAVLGALLPTYLGASKLLGVYGVFVLLLSVLGGGAHITVLYAMNREKTVLWISLVAGFINLALDLVLIYWFGVMGALIATGVSSVIARVLELVLVRRAISIAYPFRFCAMTALCLVAAGVLAFMVPFSGLTGLAVRMALFAVGYIVSALLVRPIEAEDMDGLLVVSPRLAAYLVPFSRNAHPTPGAGG